MKTKNILIILSLIILSVSIAFRIAGYISNENVLKILSDVLIILSSVSSLSFSFSIIIRNNSNHGENNVSGNSNVVAGRDITINNGGYSYSEKEIELLDEVYNLLSIEGRIYFDKIIHYLETGAKTQYRNVINDLDMLVWRKCMHLIGAEMGRDNPKANQYKSLLNVLGYFLAQYRGTRGEIKADEDFQIKESTIEYLKSLKNDLDNISPVDK